MCTGSLLLGTLGLCPADMWLGRSGQSRGPRCVCACPGVRESVLRPNRYLLPVTFLGSGQALPWGGTGLVGRPALGQMAAVPRTTSSS